MPSFDVVYAVADPSNPEERRVKFTVMAASGDAAVTEASTLAVGSFPPGSYSCVYVGPEGTGTPFDAAYGAEPDPSVRTVADFGAVGDGTTDDTAAFLKAAAHAYGNNTPLLIPAAPVSWRLTDTVPLYTGMRVEGVGYHSVILWDGGDKPVFARHNYADRGAGDVTDVALRKFRIDDYSEGHQRPTNWTIDLSNGDSHLLESVEIEGRLASPTTDYYGVIVGKHPDGSYAGNTWEPRMINCKLRRAKALWNTTDGCIEGGFIYAFGRDYALQLGGGNVVNGVHFVGGQTYGSIYLKSPENETIFAVKVFGCQFDGNNSNNTMYGVYAPASQEVVSCNIGNGTHMWNHNREFVRLENARACLVAGGVYRQGDADDTGEADIYVAGYDNTVGPNSHYRANTAPKKEGGSTVRVNLSPPVTIVDSGGAGNRLIPGSVSEDSNDYTTRSFAHLPNVNAAAVDEFRDDFNGRALNTTQWGTALGTDGACALALTNGEAVLTLGTTNPSTLAANGVQLDRALAFRSDSGGLFFETKIRTTNATGVAMFVGFTNQTGTLEMPFTLGAGPTIASSAPANAVGFIFDSAGGTTWYGVGTKANVDTALLDTTATSPGGTNRVLRVELTNGGTARFFVDGAYAGERADAVTATTWLTPVVVAFSRNTTAKNVVLGYVWAGQARR